MKETLTDDLLQIFGEPDDPMREVEERARKLLSPKRWIIWQGDPQTFAFSYVGGDAEELLGHPSERWVSEEAFWADVVVHPDDRDDAIAYCALATGKGVDHIFNYRAVTDEGEVVWLKDYVRVGLGPKGVPIHLRGLMIEIDDEEASADSVFPPVQDLERLPAIG